MNKSSILRSFLPPRSAVWLVVGLLAGLGGGIFVALKWIAPAVSWQAAVGRSFMLTEIAFGQYQEADYEAAKSALEDLLSYLESVEPSEGAWEPGHSPLLDERGLAFDKALTAGRLALLEERENHPAAAVAYWDQAENHARAAGWQDPSRENLRRFLTRLDRDRSPDAAPDPGLTEEEAS